jgi:hypothetical protein
VTGDNVATGATSPSGERHPGEILYQDRVEHRTFTRKAADVPTAVAWVEVGDEQWKPVVRIEITAGQGDECHIAKFGPGHELLDTTNARLPRPVGR